MPDWVALGDRAIRFPRPAVPARVLVRAIRAWPGVIDVVVAPHEVAAYFADTPVVDPARITRLAELDDDPAHVRTIELRVRYDGPDLEDVARITSLTTDEVIRLHHEATYTVDTLGFSPGFAYLAGLDPRLVIPRRSTPRPRVPAGSLAIADVYTAIYPFDSPGGWHLLGSLVEGRMFDAHGALLQAGDHVRFVS